MLPRTRLVSLIPLTGALVIALGAIGCNDDPAPANPNPGPAMNHPDALPPPPVEPTILALSESGHDRLYAVTFDPSGNLYATGQMADGTAEDTDFRLFVLKLKPNGERDASFGNGGIASKNVGAGRAGELARGIVVQTSGKIVVSGTVEHAGAADNRDRDIALVRFNTDGSVDDGFGTQGVRLFDLSAGEPVGMGYVADAAWGLSRYEDDRLVIMGSKKADGRTDSDFALLRLSADGEPDGGFATAGIFSLDIGMKNASARTATILPDGKIVGVGYMDDGTVVAPVLFRVTAAGMLDGDFGNGGIFHQPVLPLATEAYAAVLQDTKLVTIGYGRAQASESLDWLSLRIDEKGALDTSWGTSGVTRIDLAGFNDNGRNLVALPDGRLLLVGGARPAMDNVDAMIALLSASGQPDESLAPQGRKVYDLGGTSDFFWGAALSPDQRTVAIVGIKGFAAGSGQDDDAAVLLLPRP